LILDLIYSGRCPRCEGPLPTLPDYPAGSRITAYRSIPICGPCGSDEAFEEMDGGRGIGWGLSSAGCWPLPVDEINERRDRYYQHMEFALLTTDGYVALRRAPRR
jgi:hypothetical protein